MTVGMEHKHLEAWVSLKINADFCVQLFKKNQGMW